MYSPVEEPLFPHYGDEEALAWRNDLFRIYYEQGWADADAAWAAQIAERELDDQFFGAHWNPRWLDDYESGAHQLPAVFLEPVVPPRPPSSPTIARLMEVMALDIDWSISIWRLYRRQVREAEEAERAALGPPPPLRHGFRRPRGYGAAGRLPGWWRRQEWRSRMRLYFRHPDRGVDRLVPRVTRRPHAPVYRIQRPRRRARQFRIGCDTSILLRFL